MVAADGSAGGKNAHDPGAGLGGTARNQQLPNSMANGGDGWWCRLPRAVGAFVSTAPLDPIAAGELAQTGCSVVGASPKRRRLLEHAQPSTL